MATYKFIAPMVLLLAWSVSGLAQEFEQIEAEQVEQATTSNRWEQLDVTRGGPGNDLISGRSSETGLMGAYDLAHDTSRFSMAYMANSNPRKLTDIAMFDFIYGRQFGEHLWWEIYASTASIKFRTLSETNNNQGANESEQLESTSTNVNFGFGLSMRTTYIRDFLGFDQLFETIAAYAAATRFNEEHFDQQYLGLGVRADYGVHYRLSKLWHLGIKFSYHLYSAERSEVFVDEPQSSRDLSVNYLAAGLDVALYF